MLALEEGHLQTFCNLLSDDNSLAIGVATSVAAYRSCVTRLPWVYFPADPGGGFSEAGTLLDEVAGSWGGHAA